MVGSSWLGCPGKECTHTHTHTFSLGLSLTPHPPSSHLVGVWPGSSDALDLVEDGHEEVGGIVGHLALREDQEAAAEREKREGVGKGVQEEGWRVGEEGHGSPHSPSNLFSHSKCKTFHSPPSPSVHFTSPPPPSLFLYPPSLSLHPPPDLQARGDALLIPPPPPPSLSFPPPPNRPAGLK
jgi:hypothetical protein